MRTARLLTVCCSVPGGGGYRPPLMKTCPGCKHTPPDADLQMHTPLYADSPGWRPPGHVTCDACWEANPSPIDRQTIVKTLPCPKLGLRAVINPHDIGRAPQNLRQVDRNHSYKSKRTRCCFEKWWSHYPKSTESSLYLHLHCAKASVYFLNFQGTSLICSHMKFIFTCTLSTVRSWVHPHSQLDGILGGYSD